MPMKFKSTFVSQDSSQQESPSQSKQLLLTIKIIIFYTQADNKEMSREVEGGELLEQESQKKRKKGFKSEQTHNVSKYNVRNCPKILKRFCDLMYSSPLKSSAHFHLSSFSLSTDTLTSGLRPV